MYKKFVIVHTALAGFFLPMGLMYAITGGLYGLGIKGNYQSEEYALQLAEPLPTELSGLVALAERELRQRDIELPTGNAGVKKGGTSYYFEWTGSRRDVELQPTADPRQAILKVKETTPHRLFVQLHKAKGGTAFKWFAAVWMVGLVSLFITGSVMAYYAKAYRRIALVSGALGIAVFVVMVALN